MGNPKTANKHLTTGGLASALFPRVRLRVLGVLYGNPQRQYLISEVIRLTKSGNGAVARELERLKSAALIVAQNKHYQANTASPIFAELRGIVLKTVGIVEPLREALRAFERRIAFAFVYGSMAKGLDTADSDIDLFIVSDDLAYADVFKVAQKAEKHLQRAVNPTLLTGVEWKRKRMEKNSFIRKIADQPRLFVLGTDYGDEGA